MSKEESKLTVAKKILAQLGGNQFLLMTGCKNLVGDENSLRMRLAKNKSKANFLQITLGGNDFYTMRFFYYRAGRYKVLPKEGKVVEIPEKEEEVKRFEGVYSDMLCSLFTEVTGLETRMPKVFFQS